MPKQYLVHNDRLAGYRNSEGVLFVRNQRANNNRTVFYCDEYAIFWTDIADVGDFDKSYGFERGIDSLVPVMWEEVESTDLRGSVDCILERGMSPLAPSRRIEVPRDAWNDKVRE